MRGSRLARLGVGVLAAVVALTGVGLTGLGLPSVQAAVVHGISGSVLLGEDRTTATAGEVQVTLRKDSGLGPVTHSVVTDEEGRYDLVNVPFDYYRMTVHDTHERFPDLVFYVWPDAGPLLDVYLGGDGPISGTVTAGDTGDGVRGEVRLYGVGIDGSEREFDTRSDSLGRYAFDVLPRSAGINWTLEFFPYNVALAPVTWNAQNLDAAPSLLTADDLATGVARDATLPAAARISGEVGGDVPATDFASIRVRIFLQFLQEGSGQWVPARGHYIWTEPDGTYTTHRLGPGSYRVEARWGHGGAVQRRFSPTVTIVAGATGTADFAFPRDSYTRDYSGDGIPEILARTPRGALRAYPPGASPGHLGTHSILYPDLSTTKSVVNAGDFTGDGLADLITRDRAGSLWLRPGTGANGFSAKVRIATGLATATAIVAPGDVDGDGDGDLVIRGSSGTLYLYPGDGAGHLAGRVKLSTGWNSYTALLAPGDFDLDGHPDLIARGSSGKLYVFSGTGTGFGTRTQVASGWNRYERIASVGDFDGDLIPDVLTLHNGHLLIHAGDGAGRLQSPVWLTSVWDSWRFAS